MPDSVQARPDSQGLDDSVKVIRCPAPEPGSDIVRRAIAFANRCLHGEITPGSGWLKQWRSAQVRAELEAAQYVEIHWSAFLPLIAGVREVTTATCAIVEHDVHAQGLRRRARSDRRMLRRVAAKVASRIAARMEARLCNAYDEVLVYSDKDRQLLRRMGVTIPIEQIDFLVPWPAQPAPLSSRTVLFTGALYRPENHQSAVWLIERVWPRVLDACPDARLVIAGSNPATSLLDRAGTDVTVHGFVEDLLDLYTKARVFAAPLVLGAGVKVKVLEAAAVGLPIVSTSIGAEGYPDEILTRADDPTDFDDGLIHFLTDDGAASTSARVARTWAKSRPAA
ncbi:MAG TPA: glycosyltransferase [Solirubrobacteraceae bacterium]|nr:glycosyltransferase [Solirubrobacteraceae bacterium]